MKRRTHIPTLLLLLTLSSGCFLLEQPNDVGLGRVQVDAILVADTCGPGTVSAGPTMHYEVELTRRGSTLVWEGPSGAVHGTFLAEDEFCIELANNWHVREPDPWLEDPGCQMTQVERLCGTMDLVEGDQAEMEVEQVTSLTARHELFVSNISGTSCPELLGVSEGQYLALPCQVVYDIEGLAAEQQ